MLLIRVRVYTDAKMTTLLREYVMDHNDDQQRRTLGQQCRNAFEGGQAVVTTVEGMRPC